MTENIALLDGNESKTPLFSRIESFINKGVYKGTLSDYSICPNFHFPYGTTPKKPIERHDMEEKRT